MQRLLANDPVTRAQFEAAAGGSVSTFTSEGVMVLQRYAATRNASVGVTANPMAGTVMGALFAMDQAIMQASGQLRRAATIDAPCLWGCGQGERSEVERALGWISGLLRFESVEVSLRFGGIDDGADRRRGLPHRGQRSASRL